MAHSWLKMLKSSTIRPLLTLMVLATGWQSWILTTHPWAELPVNHELTPHHGVSDGATDGVSETLSVAVTGRRSEWSPEGVTHNYNYAHYVRSCVRMWQYWLTILTDRAKFLTITKDQNAFMAAVTLTLTVTFFCLIWQLCEPVDWRNSASSCLHSTEQCFAI